MASGEEITIENWHDWYVERYPDAFDKATDKIYAQVQNLRDAIPLIDREMVKHWVEDLVIAKTFNGMYVQKAILASLAERKGTTYRLATPEEEGLAMVQAQAIACNLPLVGSKDSGAEDLKEIVEHSECITIIEDFTPDALLKAIDLSIIKQKQLNGIQYAGNAAERLTWQAYGDRYSEFINKIARK